MIISPIKLIKMAKKWRNQVSTKKNKITPLPPTTRSYYHKGHFAVYTMEDKKRSMVPIACLDNKAFRQLLDISEEEFGPHHDGPIRLPCDGPCLASLIKRAAHDRDLIRTVVTSLTCVCNGRGITSSCSLNNRRGGRTGSSQQLLVSSY
ncbi:Auxin-responsive protein SAUR66 [Linum perenne]